MPVGVWHTSAVKAQPSFQHQFSSFYPEKVRLAEERTQLSRRVISGVT